MSNPIFDRISRNTFGLAGSGFSARSAYGKTLGMLGLTFLSAIIFTSMLFTGPLMGGALIFGGISLLTTVVIGLVLLFKPLLAKYLTPIYAIAEGVLLGFISYMFEAMYPGVVLQAVLGTAGLAVGMAALYYFGFIRVTNKLIKIVIGMALGISLIYLANLVFSLFGLTFMQATLMGQGTLGLIFVLVSLAVASFCFVIDLDMIESYENSRMPKDYEWVAVYGLLSSLIWMYIEMLKLMARLRY